MHSPPSAFLLLLLPTSIALSPLLLPRRVLLQSLSLLLSPPPPSCTSSSSTPFCLGSVDGLLADCSGARCASSQDDRPAYFQPPWDLDGGRDPLDRILLACEARGDFVGVVEYDPVEMYLRVEFRDGEGRDDVEFLKTRGDDTVQFRSGAREGKVWGGVNQKARLEELRKALGYYPLPVLRNRRRAFFFVESDLDNFGPSSNRDPTDLGGTPWTLLGPLGDQG